MYRRYRDIPHDLWYIIFSFLSYSERAVCLRLCRSMKGLVLDRFSGVILETITWPGRTDPSYQMVHHPYPSPCLHPMTYLGHHYISFVLYDTSFSYFYFRCMRPYEAGKTLQEYLAEYSSETDHMNHIRHLFSSALQR